MHTEELVFGLNKRKDFDLDSIQCIIINISEL